MPRDIVEAPLRIGAAIPAAREASRPPPAAPRPALVVLTSRSPLTPHPVPFVRGMKVPLHYRGVAVLRRSGSAVQRDAGIVVSGCQDVQNVSLRAALTSLIGRPEKAMPQSAL